MDDKHNQHSGGGNGFLIGVIVGVIIALLFTTKRGRKVLHVLTEKGFERFSDIQNAIVDEEDEEEGEDYVESSERQESVEEVTEAPEPASTNHPMQNHEEHSIQPAPKQIPASSNPQPSPVKRFFKKKN